MYHFKKDEKAQHESRQNPGHTRASTDRFYKNIPLFQLNLANYLGKIGNSVFFNNNNVYSGKVLTNQISSLTFTTSME